MRIRSIRDARLEDARCATREIGAAPVLTHAMLDANRLRIEVDMTVSAPEYPHGPLAHTRTVRRAHPRGWQHQFLTAKGPTHAPAPGMGTVPWAQPGWTGLYVTSWSR